MESVVYEDSPLAAYLEGEGGKESHGILSDDKDVQCVDTSSPTFAPRGIPKVRSRFRNKLPPPLRLNIPQTKVVALVQETCSRAINSRLGKADNAKFLERFRYSIVASQLLSGQTYLGQALHGRKKDVTIPAPNPPQFAAASLVGASVTAALAFVLPWMIDWVRRGSPSITSRSRTILFLLIWTIILSVGYAFTSRQWLKYLRQQTLSEISELLIKAQEFDHVATGAMTLVQEVELVSRGYRISIPLPPISRLEDRSQTRRCTRLRTALRLCFAEIIPRYNHACTTIKPLAEPMDLEKYYDIYDISESDSSEAMLGFSESEFEDLDSLRVLKILAGRFHTARNIFLCCLMALEANGDETDSVRWTIAMEEIHALGVITSAAEERLRQILEEEESFPVPATPKLPLTPNRERWRAQLRKLNSLSSGIRGLQAKLHVLRDESDRNLNEAADVSELGANLMIQYESIGVDLKALMQEWEDGKAALASNIDRNERRLSSMSGMLSPTISLGGLTAVDEGNVSDALRALNGETRSRSSMEFSSSDVEEVFEAVAMPKQRSTLTRDERIAKMKQDRIKRESLKEKAEANTHMLRELESVINMRPRGRTTGGGGRITSI